MFLGGAACLAASHASEIWPSGRSLGVLLETNSSTFPALNRREPIRNEKTTHNLISDSGLA